MKTLPYDQLFEENPEFYRPFIVQLFPNLRGAGLKMHQGWYSIAIDADNRLIFKFPKNDLARQALKKEAILLAVIQPRIRMRVPEMQLHEEGKGEIFFSIHKKIPGEALEREKYHALSEAAKNKLAKKIAQFYLQLHCLNAEELRVVGVNEIEVWHSPEEILNNVIPLLNNELQSISKEIVYHYSALSPDPYGTTFGFFDGHGWNMAFDHQREILNGIYNFADSGFGSVHQEFIYSNFISPDLTGRIITAYEKLSQRSLDRQRINILTSYHRLSEIADIATMHQHLPKMIQHYQNWLESLNMSIIK